MKRPVAILVAFAWFAKLSLAAGPDQEREIKLVFDREAVAAELKFVDGMLSHRTRDYELYDPKGKLVDLSLEKMRFGGMFESALRVQLDTKILKCVAVSADSADCYVEQSLNTEYLTQANRLYVSTLRTVSRELWVNTGTSWRVRRCQVFSQTLGEGEPLPPVYLRPTKFFDRIQQRSRVKPKK